MVSSAVGGAVAVGHQAGNPFFAESREGAPRRRRNSAGSSIPSLNRAVSLGGAGAGGVGGSRGSGEPRKKRSRSTLPASVGLGGGIAAVAPAQRKDSRPLRDKNFQLAIEEEILQYLQAHGFDRDTQFAQGALTLKILQTPTQKTYMLIFRWLYARVDPNYTFKRSVEAEFYDCLKRLGCPFLADINKSQISAVGGSQWHKFLGLLHWFVKFNSRMDSIREQVDNVAINEPAQNILQTTRAAATVEEQDQIKQNYERLLESLVNEYTMDTYKLFLLRNENYGAMKAKFETNVEKFVQVIHLDINNLQNENEKLLAHYDTVLGKTQELRIAKEKLNNLQNDVAKYQMYIDDFTAKQAERPAKLHNMQRRAEEHQKQIDELKEQIQRLLEEMKLRGLSLERVEDLNKQKEILLQTLDNLADQSDKLIASMQNKKLENKTLKTRISALLNEYNASIELLFERRFQKTGRSVENIQEYTLDLEKQLAAVDENSKLVYNSLFNKGPEYSMEDALTNRFVRLMEDIEVSMESLMNDITELEQRQRFLEENIESKEWDNMQLAQKLRAMQEQNSARRRELERELESQKKIAFQLQNRNEETLRQIELRIGDAKALVQDKKAELEQLKVSLQQEKKQTEQQMLERVQYIENFRVTIQESLNQTSDIVVEELQKLKLDQ
ncbi:kinetochore-associated Ndc80 complex subunit NDC80 KNAG_0L02080 [Huiozyma naganishii CBS 8797]|uniref:Kinetochore protein NDC80 n=1 Tax=Huiozyma naganishii (strain ATCC MYA-139 / BCRC 22969 / CBS 8797 / KCTC 17520 / NBRC 10181 / NCYC 3082 / Yp74L-3) TaxID=1071383 RepID=J7SB80_HUIN7|nr:hypothetical protein KNAG_0L02080 [Kazachstania naganishii CBS 8797]CCK72826.1 hypothetical protein KNAG_0L02080 [Kazachstania naganishii CBS 8797]